MKVKLELIIGGAVGGLSPGRGPSFSRTALRIWAPAWAWARPGPPPGPDIHWRKPLPATLCRWRMELLNEECAIAMQSGLALALFGDHFALTALYNRTLVAVEAVTVTGYQGAIDHLLSTSACLTTPRTMRP